MANNARGTLLFAFVAVGHALGDEYGMFRRSRCLGRLRFPRIATINRCVPTSAQERGPAPGGNRGALVPYHHKISGMDWHYVRHLCEVGFGKVVVIHGRMSRLVVERRWRAPRIAAARMARLRPPAEPPSGSNPQFGRRPGHTSSPPNYPTRRLGANSANKPGPLMIR